MITNQFLQTFPEIKQYKLINLLTKDEHFVTEEMLANAFSDRPDELLKVRSGRSDAWLLEDVYFD